MLRTLPLLMGLLVVFALPAVAAETKQPITQQEMESILRAGSTPQLLKSATLTEAYTRKYYAPDVQVWTENEIHAGDTVRHHDQKYDGIDELLSTLSNAKAVGGDVFHGMPTVSGEEMVSFSYDPQTGQAVSVYQYVVEGELPPPLHISMKTGQICQNVAERQGPQQEIMIILVGCKQKIVMQRNDD